MKEYTTHDDYEYIHVSDVNEVAVVCFDDLPRAVNDCDGSRIDGLAEELLAVVDQEAWTSIILDFEDEVFIPYAIFEAVLVRLHKMLGERLKLCNLPALVIEHFEINRLATVFHIYPTREDALKATKS